jgi:hypothetical protein
MLHKLHDAVRRWATALAGDDQYWNPDLVRQQLTARKLQGRNAVEAYAPRYRLRPRPPSQELAGFGWRDEEPPILSR